MATPGLLGSVFLLIFGFLWCREVVLRFESDLEVLKKSGDRRQKAVVILLWGATVIIITNRESDDLLHTLIWLRQTGFSPTLVLVNPQRSRQLTAQLEFPTYEIWVERDIEVWLPSL